MDFQCEVHLSNTVIHIWRELGQVYGSSRDFSATISLIRGGTGETKLSSTYVAITAVITAGSRAFSYTDPTCWNSRPINLTDSDISLSTFKRHLNRFSSPPGYSARLRLVTKYA